MQENMILMKNVIADLHIHSRFSRACSKDLNLENLEKWARVKGLGLLGTGDFMHPEWLKELKKNLEEKNGILYSKNGFKFILTGEVSLIYTEKKGRRVHLIVLAPNFGVVDKINEWLDTKGRRDYDGRPIFKISCEDFTAKMNLIDDRIEVIPAHAWTPWFGIYGSESGFNSLKEAFGSQTDKIHAIETGMSCYDIETEVLTINGWKKVSDIQINDEICTLNIEKDFIEFQKPLKLFKYYYKGKMYRLKTKRVDIFVTPNHKLLYCHCNFKKKLDFKLERAELLFNKSKRFKKNGRWAGKNSDYFVLPAVEIKHGSKYYSGARFKEEKKFPIKSWLGFFGFWIAEGWTSEGKNGDYGVYLANSNSTIMNEMKNILISFGYQPYIYKNRGLSTMRIRDFQLFSYLGQFGKANRKFVPIEVKSLSKELLEIFFNYYIKGDGNIYGRNLKGLRATTISRLLRDDLQEIALKIGMSAYYKIHRKKGTLIVSLPKANLKGYKQLEDSWSICFIRKNIHTVMPSTIKKWNYIERWEDYNDFVYCLEVPNHVVYVRRNGIPVWCGNSSPEMNWKISELNNKTIVSFSDSHSFWPWRIGREATIFNNIDNYDEILDAIRNNKILGTIEVDPAYGKYHWDGHRACGFSCSLKETKELDGKCPKCKKELVIGVENRVDELTNQETREGKKFYKLLPLHELIAFYLNSGLTAKKVWEIYNKLIDKFKNEFNVLLNVKKEEFFGFNDKLIELIIKNREGKIKVKPGYDGVYGEIIDEQKKLFL